MTTARWCTKHQDYMIHCCGNIGQTTAIEAAYAKYGGRKKLMTTPYQEKQIRGFRDIKAKDSAAWGGTWGIW